MFLNRNQFSKRVAVNTAALLCAVGLSGQSTFAGGICTANELSKVVASDATGGDEHGRSVEISGDVAIVGARLNDDAGNDAGAAYIYRFDGTTWNQEAKLIGNDVVAGDHFGLAVDIDGDVAVVGSARDPWTFGSAYVFRFDGEAWNQDGKVEANVPSNADHFGESVAIQGEKIAVGAPRDSDSATQGGAVYVFYNDKGKGWSYEWKNFADDAQSGDRLGTKVNISGDAIIAGAMGDDDQGSGSGSAYVFQYNGAAWLHYAKLLASNGAAGANFGTDVDISGDYAIVGANTADTGAGTDAGSAYIYLRDQDDQQIWTEIALLTASDATAIDRFGISVSISGNMATVGAFRTDHAGSDSGSAYLYEQDTNGPDMWGEVAKLLAADAAGGDWYGWSVAIDGDKGFVGSYRDDDNGASSGSAYAFSGLSDCNENGITDICDILQGESDDTNGNGTPDECEAEPCVADIDDNGSVGTSDLLILFVEWGPNPDSPADIDGNGIVGTSDLLILFSNWGPCP